MCTSTFRNIQHTTELDMISKLREYWEPSELGDIFVKIDASSHSQTQLVLGLHTL